MVQGLVSGSVVAPATTTAVASPTTGSAATSAGTTTATTDTTATTAACGAACGDGSGGCGRGLGKQVHVETVEGACLARARLYLGPGRGHALRLELVQLVREDVLVKVPATPRSNWPNDNNNA